MTLSSISGFDEYVLVCVTEFEENLEIWIYFFFARLMCHRIEKFLKKKFEKYEFNSFGLSFSSPIRVLSNLRFFKLILKYLIFIDIFSRIDIKNFLQWRISYHCYLFSNCKNMKEFGMIEWRLKFETVNHVCRRACAWFRKINREREREGAKIKLGK